MTTLIPRSVLFGNPERMSPAISPDGARTGFVAPVDGVLNVWVAPVGAEARPITADRGRGISSFSFAHDGRHVLYVQDEGGDENWHVLAVDLDDPTVGPRDLTPYDGVQAAIVGMDKDHPEEVLVSMNRENPELADVYRLTVATGALEKVAANPGFVGWIVDRNLGVRGGVAPTPDGGFVVLIRDTGADAPDAGGSDASAPDAAALGYRPVHTVGMEDALGVQPVGLSAAGDALHLITPAGANTSRLVRLDLASGEQVVVAEDSRYDVTAAVLDRDTQEVQLVGIQGERLEWRVLDRGLGADVERIAARHPEATWSPVGRDRDGRVWLIAYEASDGPVTYESYDRSTGASTFLFVHQPALLEHRGRLAPMEPFAFNARDSLHIEGYLTFPVGVERRALPAVLNVHGGPWARDKWGFDSSAQWLADRGYVCIQVNYRGSTGYGKDFLNAGNRAWAAEMHDDLLDAIDHCVGQGWIDPARVAILGGSYGGYAALVGATFTPERFACAVDIVGPSNLKTLIESIPPYWAPLVRQFHDRIGNPETEADFLWSRSPLSRVDQISIPLLIAQGANDPRVKQAESEQIVEAMKARGIPHEYALYEDEGHGFVRPENRLDFFGRAERFLARHLGGACEEEPSAL